MTLDPHDLTDLGSEARSAVAAERERIAKRLHDDVVQSVSVAALRIEMLQISDAASAEDLREAQEAMRAATQQLRDLMGELRRPPAGA